MQETLGALAGIVRATCVEGQLIIQKDGGIVRRESYLGKELRFYVKTGVPVVCPCSVIAGVVPPCARECVLEVGYESGVIRTRAVWSLDGLVEERGVHADE